MKTLSFKKIKDPLYWKQMRDFQKNDFDSYEYILIELLTKYPFVLNHLPYDLQTPTTVDMSLRTELTTFQNLNKSYITADHISFILRSEMVGTTYLEYVPDHFKTAETCMAFLRQNFFNFRYIPEHLNPKKIIIELLKNNGFVSKRNKSFRAVTLMETKACFDYFNDITFANELCSIDPYYYQAHPHPTPSNQITMITKYPELRQKMMKSLNISRYDDLTKFLYKQDTILKYL